MLEYGKVLFGTEDTRSGPRSQSSGNQIRIRRGQSAKGGYAKYYALMIRGKQYPCHRPGQVVESRPRQAYLNFRHLPEIWKLECG